MAEVLRSIGKTVRIINAHRTPEALQFLDPAGNIEVLGDDVEPEDITADCIMVLDTSAWAQLGDMGDVIRSSRADKIVIDHHVGEDDLNATMYKDYQSEVRVIWSCKLPMHLVFQLPDPWPCLSSQPSQPIQAGFASAVSLLRPTGRWRLIDAGVVPCEVYGDLYERDLGQGTFAWIGSFTNESRNWRHLDAHLCRKRRF